MEEYSNPAHIRNADNRTQRIAKNPKKCFLFIYIGIGSRTEKAVKEKEMAALAFSTLTRKKSILALNID